jgi:hypothetical protein
MGCVESIAGQSQWASQKLACVSSLRLHPHRPLRMSWRQRERGSRRTVSQRTTRTQSDATHACVSMKHTQQNLSNLHNTCAHAASNDSGGERVNSVTSITFLLLSFVPRSVLMPDLQHTQYARPIAYPDTGHKATPGMRPLCPVSRGEAGHHSGSAPKRHSLRTLEHRFR